MEIAARCCWVEAESSGKQKRGITFFNPAAKTFHTVDSWYFEKFLF